MPLVAPLRLWLLSSSTSMVGMWVVTWAKRVFHSNRVPVFNIPPRPPP